MKIDIEELKRQDKYTYESLNVKIKEINKIKEELMEKGFPNVSFDLIISKYKKENIPSPIIINDLNNYINKYKKDLLNLFKNIQNKIIIIDINDYKNNPFFYEILELVNKDSFKYKKDVEISKYIENIIIKYLFKNRYKEELNNVYDNLIDLKVGLKYAKQNIKQSNDKFINQIESSIKIFHQNNISKLVSKVYNINVEDSNEIDFDVKEYKKTNESIATVRDDALHTLIFPYNSNKIPNIINKKQKNKDDLELIKEANDLNKIIKDMKKTYVKDKSKKQTGNVIVKVEIDFDKNKKTIEKIENIKKIKKTIEIIKSQSMTLDRPFILRFRKISKKQKANGMYYFNQNQEDSDFDQIIIDTESPGSIIHELGHLIDLTKLENTKERNYMVEKYANKLNLKKERKVSYYYKPTEIVARLVELGHLLKYPEETKDIIKLVKKEEEYISNEDIYFDYTKLTKEEKKEIIYFYDIYFENTLEKDVNLDLFKVKFLQKQMQNYRSLRLEKAKEKLNIWKKDNKSIKSVLRKMNNKIMKDMFEKINNNPGQEMNKLEMIIFFDEAVSSLLLTNNVESMIEYDNIVQEEYEKLKEEEKLDLIDFNKDIKNNMDKKNHLYLISRNKTIAKNIQNIKREEIKKIEIEKKEEEKIPELRKMIDDIERICIQIDRKEIYGLLNKYTIEDYKRLLKLDKKKMTKFIIDELKLKKEKEIRKRELQILTYFKENKIDLTNIEIENIISNVIDKIETKYKLPNYIKWEKNIIEKFQTYKEKQTEYDKRNLILSIKDLLNQKRNEYEKFINVKEHLGNDLKKVIDDVDLFLPEQLRNKEVINLMKTENNELFSIFMDEIKSQYTIKELKELELFEYIEASDEKKEEEKIIYQIEKIIPIILKKKEKLNKNNFMNELLKELPDLSINNIKELPNVRYIIEMIEEVYEKIEFLDSLQEQIEQIGVPFVVSSNEDDFVEEYRKVLVSDFISLEDSKRIVIEELKEEGIDVEKIDIIKNENIELIKKEQELNLSIQKSLEKPELKKLKKIYLEEIDILMKSLNIKKVADKEKIEKNRKA